MSPGVLERRHGRFRPHETRRGGRRPYVRRESLITTRTHQQPDEESKHYTFDLRKCYTVVFGAHYYGTNCFLLPYNRWDLS